MTTRELWGIIASLGVILGGMTAVFIDEWRTSRRLSAELDHWKRKRDAHGRFVRDEPFSSVLATKKEKQ